MSTGDDMEVKMREDEQYGRNSDEYAFDPVEFEKEMLTKTPRDQDLYKVMHTEDEEKLHYKAVI